MTTPANIDETIQPSPGVARLRELQLLFERVAAGEMRMVDAARSLVNLRPAFGEVGFASLDTVARLADDLVHEPELRVQSEIWDEMHREVLLLAAAIESA